MPKRVNTAALAEVLEHFRGLPQGLTAAELLARPGVPDRRTLQRWLARLVAEGKLVQAGKSRGTRYRLAPVVGTAHLEAGPDTLAAQGEAYVPTSPAGTEIRALVRRPIAQRTPVGYKAAFLDDYQPKRTYSLGADVRARLHRLGRSPVAARPAGTYAREVFNRLLIDLSWASSRLEGNTYTRLDTQNLIEFGLVAEGRDQREAQMILNHKAAIEFLVENVDQIGFDAFTFRNLHALLAENLLPDPSSPGRPRARTVEIAGSVYLPLADPHRIGECFDRLLDKAAAIDDPFEQAFFAMAHVPYLQPFDDVNKRVSRLAANIPLLKRNLSPLSFVDVPETAYIDGTLGVYELNRTELLRDVFIWAYERSCLRYVAVKESLPSPDPLRLKYRDALTEVVAGIVRALEPADTGTIRARAAARVLGIDLDAFVAMAFSDLMHLDEGNVARHRLTIGEYRRWKEAVGPRN